MTSLILSKRNSDSQYVSRRHKSLSFKSLSNKSELKKFISKNFKVNIDKDEFKLNMSIVPSNTNLYQGTILDFDEKKLNEYYDKKNVGVYFLTSYKYASYYGINKTTKNIIYTTIPDENNVKNPTRKYEYVYPLYYLDDTVGTNVNFKSSNDLFLLNIGVLSNIKIIFKIIYSLSNISDEKKEDYISTLFATCAKEERGFKIGDYPIKSKRTSEYSTDDELVLLFKNIIIPYIKKEFNIILDGWIYYNNKIDDLHDEIMILTNKKLIYKKFFREHLSLKNSNIPTRKEFIERMSINKIKYDKKIRYNTILNNFSTII